MFGICPDDQWHNYGTMNDAEGNGLWQGDYIHKPKEKKVVRCKYCAKKENLMWDETDNGWRLFDMIFDQKESYVYRTELHSCKEYENGR